MQSHGRHVSDALHTSGVVSDGNRIFRPKTAGLDYAARERQLWDRAGEDLETWRLANQARRVLASA